MKSKRQPVFTYKASAIDSVLTTQDELGTTILDGGYGWIVFIATLFFQVLIPSTIVAFGILLAAINLETRTPDSANIYLLDEGFIYTPLFFVLGWIIFDPLNRKPLRKLKRLRNMWPRLVATAGTCVTCAGLLFMWMGLAANYGSKTSVFLFILAGLFSGIGGSVQMAQCEILLAQYFRLKYAYLLHFSQIIVAVGFIITPVVIGHLVMNYHILRVVLGYQSVIFLGLFVNIVLKKPEYLESKTNYNYMSDDMEEERDIFSKGITEMQFRRNDISNIVKNKDQDVKNVINSEPSTSAHSDDNALDSPENTRGAWIMFHDENESKNKYTEIGKWETFEQDDGLSEPDGNKNEPLPQKLIFTTDALNQIETREQIDDSYQNPVPLFNETSVNMNYSYAYEEYNEIRSTHTPDVFAPNLVVENNPKIYYLTILKQPTFYKSLLTMITTKYSLFIFYSLFPSYFFIKITSMKFIHASSIIGALSIVSLLFTGVSYCVNINKKGRPVFLCLFCLLGTFGYCMISESTTEHILIIGAILIVASISSLQHIGGPLLGLTVKGEFNKEYVLLSYLTGLSFCLFLVMNLSYKSCFRLMALLHFSTGSIWFFNFIYKRTIAVR